MNTITEISFYTSFYTKYLKFGVHFTLKAHLNVD